jgi:hypothetical protein
MKAVLSIFISTVLGMTVLGCSTLTHMEKQEKKFSSKFDMEKVTLVIKSESGEISCFATLISRTTAITAASCVKNQKVSISQHFSKEDDVDPEDIEKLEILNVHLHPKYRDQGSPSHTNIAILKLKPSLALNDLNVYYPKIMVFKNSHMRFVKKRKALFTQSLEDGIKNRLYKKSSFSKKTVSIDLADMSRDLVKPGAVGSLKYYKTFMLSGIYSKPTASTKESELTFTPFYLSKDFLTKHLGTRF